MPSHFARSLAERQPDPAGRRWVFVPYDQLTDAVGPLAQAEAGELGIVLVECPARAARRPYHRQKLALVLANQRHFALEQAARGVAVRYVVTDGTCADALTPLARKLGPLTMMRAAERELRMEVAPLVEDGRVVEVPHEGWLTSPDDLRASQQGPPWRMDQFYPARQTADGPAHGGRSSRGREVVVRHRQSQAVARRAASPGASALRARCHHHRSRVAGGIEFR
ncbi:MAG: cryptochrome/photolyase family protein [Vicinamibacterales bacterium]